MIVRQGPRKLLSAERDMEVAGEAANGRQAVEKHRNHVMRKLDIHETAGLTRYAIAAGLVESSVQVTIV